MKLIAFITFSFLIALPAQAGDKVRKRPITVYELSQLIFSPRAHKIPKEVRNVPLTHFYTKGNVLSYRYYGIYMRFEIVGKSHSLIRFNGKDFSAKDFSSVRALKLAYRSKFGVVDDKTKFAWENVESGRHTAYDVTGIDDNDEPLDYAIPPYRTEGKTAVGDGVVFEGMDTNPYIVNDKDSGGAMSDSEYARQMAIRYEAQKAVMRTGMQHANGLNMEFMIQAALAMQMMDSEPFQVIFGKGASVGGGPAVGDIPTPQGT